MFQSESSPPVPPDAELRSLRRSLNRPVLAIDELPVGPASAALAIHAGADGPRLTLAVRSARGGRVVFFRPDAALGAPGDPALAAEAALSFAEGMGFLFDEDELEMEGAEAGEAVRHWRAIAGGPDPGLAGAEPAPPGPEILLDRPADPGPPVLTKFRRAEPAPGASEPPEARAPSSAAWRG